MKRFYVRVFLGFLIGLMAAWSGTFTTVATAADPVTLEVYDPTGAYEITQLHAPRLKDLNGVTLCEISSYNWEWASTFPVIRATLQKQYPGLKIIPYDKVGINSRADEENHAFLKKMVKEKGCQAAIIGNAG
jgi:hypothetical protein